MTQGGYKGKVVAFFLACITLTISIYLHDFWALEEKLSYETQNCIKNRLY